MGVDSRGKRGREGCLTVTTPPHIAPHIENLFRTWDEMRLGKGVSEEVLERAMLAVDSLAGQGVAGAALQDYDNRIRSNVLARRGS